MSVRTRRWIRRSLIGFVALLVSAVVLTLVALHTDWGREQLRRRAVAMLRETFPGGVEIGRIEGSVLGDLDVYDVVIDDASGRPAITADHLRVNLGLLSLVGGELELETLDANGVAVRVELRPDRPSNLATMMKPSDEPSTWDVALPHVRVRDLDVTIDRAGELEHLDDLVIDAAANLPADGPIDAQVAVTGVARERAGAMLAIAGQVWIDDAGVVVPAAQLALGRAAIDVHAFTYRAAGTERPGALTGGISVLVPDGELTTLIPGSGLPAAIDLRVALDVGVQPGAVGLAAYDGDVSVTGRGAAAGVALDRIDAIGRVIDGVVYLNAWARGPGTTEVIADGQVTVDDDAIVVRRAHVEGSVASIALASAGKAPVDGSARFELDASARLAVVTTLSVHATASARRLVSDQLRIADASLEVTARGAPRAMALEVTVAGNDLRNGREVLPDVRATLRGGVSGPIAIDLDARSRTWAAKGAIGARVTLGPPDQERLLATIDLGRYRFDLPRVRIDGRGGRITLERERAIVDGLRLRGAGATLAIDGQAGLGRRAGQLDAKVELTRFDLERLGGVPGLPEGLDGIVAIEADVHRRGRSIGGVIDASATGLVLRAGTGPVDVVVGADVKPGRINLGVSAKGQALGSLAAIVDVIPPRRLDDARAWSKLDRSAIAAVNVRAERLDLARLSELAGQDPSVEGLVDAVIALDPRVAAVELHGRGLIMGGAPAPLDLDLDLDLTDATTAKVAARGTLRGLAELSLTTAVGLPSRPFDPAAWRAIDRRAVQAVELTVAEVDLDDARAARLGLEGVRGKIAALVHVEPGLSAATVQVSGRDVIAGPLITPATVAIESTIDQDHATARLALGLEGKDVALGEVKVPVGLARLLGRAPLDVAAVPIDGTITIPETPVATFTRALAERRPIAGQVHGTATISGTIAAPAATLALVVEDLGGRGAAVRAPGRERGASAPGRRAGGRGGIRELTIDARYQDGKVHGDVRGHAHDGGELAVVADVDPAAPADARASITATRFQVGPLARLAPTVLLGVRGVLDADLQLRGLDPDSARVTGVARVTGGQTPISDAVGNLRDATVELSFRGDELRATLAGAIEAGRVDATAHATLVGLLPDSAELDVTARGIELITATAPRIDGKLCVDVVRDADRWRAVARVHGARVTVPDDEGRVLHPAALPADLFFTSDLRPGMDVPRTRATALEEWLGARPSAPFLEVAVHVEPVTIVSDQLHGEVRGSFQLAIGDDGASIDGRIGVTRGKVMLFDRRYGIQRADLAFDGGVDPLLDVQLEYDFPQLTMHVSLQGRLSKPTLHLSSEPNTYTEGELLAVLLGGAPGTPGTVAPPTAVAGVAAAAATQLVGGLVARRLPVRIDVITYEAVTSESSSAFVLGRWVSPTVLVLLRGRVEPRPDENANEVEAEVWLNPRLVFEGVAGDRGVLGADLLWNRRW